jgi:hypothetical protein
MDLLERYTAIFRNAAISKGDGSDPDDDAIYETMCITYQRIDALKSAGKAKLELLRDESGWVRSWVAAQLLAEGSAEYSEEAKEVLKDLADESGLLGLAAQTTLSEYAKGELGPPLVVGDKYTLRWLEKRQPGN